MSRLVRKTWRVSRPTLAQLSGSGRLPGVSRLPCRALCSGPPSRHLPFWRRRFFDDFDHPVAKIMDHNFRRMERMMEDYVPMKWVSEFGPGRLASRDFEVLHNDKLYEVRLDVSAFAPEELRIRQTGNQLTVAGSQKQTTTHGSISREFTREILIPENVDAESLESVLTGEGQLVLRGKVKEAAESTPERVISIERGDAKTPNPSDAKEL